MRTNVALIGMPYSGKTTLGKALAASMGMRFFDTDCAVEKAAGKSVTEIFETEGESGFRDRETKAIDELTRGSGSVISCGGGAATFARNVELLRKSCVTVYLCATVEKLVGRAQGDDSRPLLKGDTAKKLRELAKAREQAYRKAADVTVDVNCTVDVALSRLKDTLSVYGFHALI